MAYGTVTLNINNENLVCFYWYLKRFDEEQWNHKVCTLLKKPVTKQRRLETNFGVNFELSKVWSDHSENRQIFENFLTSKFGKNEIKIHNSQISDQKSFESVDFLEWL